MYKLYNEYYELLVKGNSYEINNYMMYNGIDYIFEYIEKINHMTVIHFDNGCYLTIEK